MSSNQTIRDRLLAEAMAEADRFISRAHAALNEEDRDPNRSFATAAAKRASLDLTMALAKWRQAR
jgi:hypothetical protein